MSERCILAVRFTPAGASVRKAVGGFLRYVQHRDLHPVEKTAVDRQEVSGLLKYVAYRDQASARAELFGLQGTLSSQDRQAFAAYVVRSLEESRPQLYRGRNGEQQDRRRAVYRMVISPERADGLDLRRLAAAVLERLEQETGFSGLRWLAAIHRNTKHPHVHLVLAGMRQQGDGFARVDITRSRLAAMKEALALEIGRQRAERTPLRLRSKTAGVVAGGDALHEPALTPPAARPALIRTPPAAPPTRLSARHKSTATWHPPAKPSPLIQLRAVARRYQRQMEHEAEVEARRLGWERAA